MNAFAFYKLEAERKNYKKNFDDKIVEQYNRNREFVDHIKTPEEISYK